MRKEIIKISKEKLDSLYLLNCGNHYESELYLYGENELLKDIHEAFRLKRKKVLERLQDINTKGCVLPNGLVYLTPSNQFIGYTMPYLKDSKPLNIYEENDFESKKRKIMEIRNIITTLRSIKISFFDIHPGNILLSKDGKCNLIDMDSVAVQGINSISEYAKSVEYSDYYSCILALEILTGYGEDELIELINHYNDDINHIVNEKEKSIFDYASIKKLGYHSIENDMDYLCKEHFDEIKLVFKKGLL